MADNTNLSEDERVLHGMGYAQELSRRMGTFQSFAISFSIICIISGGLASFPIAMSTVGPWTATICWVLGGIFAMIVAASLGQIASAYPTAGSLYHWSSILGGKFWGWLTAWTNLLGLLFVIPAVNVILYTFIRDLFFSGMLGWDVSTWTNTTMFWWVAVITAAQCLLNHFGIKLTTMLTDFSGYLIFAITILLIILLLGHIPSFDLGKAFAFVNTTGAAGGGVAPEHGAFIAVLMGFLYPLFTITGFDASAHTSEETRDAQNTVHKGMLTSVFWSLVFGFVMALAMVLALPAVYTALAADPNQTTLPKEVMDKLAAIPGGPSPADMAVLGWGSFAALFNTLIMPSLLGKIAALGIILANFFCALSGLTSTSRMIYAFARDGGMPSVLANVNPTYRTPVPAIWFTGLISFLLVLITTPLNAFAALSTGCAMYLYMSYGMPVVAGLFAEGNTWTKFGNFRLGGLSKLFAVIVGLGVIGIMIGGHAFVPSAGEWGNGFVPGLIWYTVAFYGILCAIWALWEGRRFQGPPIGEEAIRRRQAEIAAREAQLSGRPVSLSDSGGSSGGMSSSSMGSGTAATVAAATATTAAAASSIRSSMQSSTSQLSPEEAKANAERAAAARAAAEKAAAERLTAARKKAEEMAKERAETMARAAKDDTEKVSSGSRAAGSVGNDVILVDGIGPQLKKQLAAEGINSLEDLARLTPDQIKALDAKIPRDADQIADWVQQAKDMLGGKAPRAAIDRGEAGGTGTRRAAPAKTSSRSSGRSSGAAKRSAKPKAPVADDITLVDGIGPKLKKELASAGINSLSDLSKLSSAEIVALDSRIPRDADQIADWVSQAKDLLAGKAPRAASDRARKAKK